jgi:hypothetical protein
MFSYVKAALAIKKHVPGKISNLAMRHAEVLLCVEVAPAISEPHACEMSHADDILGFRVRV